MKISEAWRQICESVGLVTIPSSNGCELFDIKLLYLEQCRLTESMGTQLSEISKKIQNMTFKEILKPAILFRPRRVKLRYSYSMHLQRFSVVVIHKRYSYSTNLQRTWLVVIHMMFAMMTSSNGNIFRVTGPLCGEFTGHRSIPLTKAMTRSFYVFFDLRLNTQLSKQSRRRRFDTLSRSLWRHCNIMCYTGYEYIYSASLKSSDFILCEQRALF